jgi:hypothetical protein
MGAISLGGQIWFPEMGREPTSELMHVQIDIFRGDQASASKNILKTKKTIVEPIEPIGRARQAHRRGITVHLPAPRARIEVLDPPCMWPPWWKVPSLILVIECDNLGRLMCLNVRYTDD